MTSTMDIAWLAGWLEGEGCFRASKQTVPVIQAISTDRDTIERVNDYFRSSIYEKRKVADHHKQAYIITTAGRRAAGIMMTVYAMMGERRKAKIREVLTNWRNSRISVSRHLPKDCTRCGAHIPTSDRLRGSRGQQSHAWCRACRSAYAREQSRKRGPRPYDRDYYLKHREKRLAYAKARYYAKTRAGTTLQMPLPMGNA